MSENFSGACQSILEEDEVARRMLLLAGLQNALHGLGVSCVLARRRKLVLRYAEGPYEPSGLTDPQLFVFVASGSQCVTTDGAYYRLGDRTFTVLDPADAAVAICAIQSAPS